MDPWDWIREFYLEQLKNGASLVQIDEMDIGFYFELLRYEPKEKEVPIDQVLF